MFGGPDSGNSLNSLDARCSLKEVFSLIIVYGVIFTGCIKVGRTGFTGIAVPRNE
jgi:hypothetical protein